MDMENMDMIMEIKKNPECGEGTKMEALVAIFWFEAGASERRGHWRLARFIF